MLNVLDMEFVGGMAAGELFKGEEVGPLMSEGLRDGISGRGMSADRLIERDGWIAG
jgi:hypothetical protein